MLITKAAIMYSNGEIMYGRNYSQIDILARKLGFSTDKKIEGFMTSTGEFSLPADAANIATKSGQVSDVVSELTPEHLWPQMVLD